MDLSRNSSLGASSILDSSSAPKQTPNMTQPVLQGSRHCKWTSSYSPALSAGRHQAKPTAVVQSCRNSKTRRPTWGEAAEGANCLRNLTSHSWVSFSQWLCYLKLSSTMICNANQYKLIIGKNGEMGQTKAISVLLSRCLRGHTYSASCEVILIVLHARSFHVSTPAKRPFTCVCVRRTFFPVSALARHPFTSVSQQHLFDVTDFPKPGVSTSALK